MVQPTNRLTDIVSLNDPKNSVQIVYSNWFKRFTLNVVLCFPLLSRLDRNVLSYEWPSRRFRETHSLSVVLIWQSKYETFCQSFERRLHQYLPWKTYAISMLSWMESSRFTACGLSSASTSMTCFAMDACFAVANGTSTVLQKRRNDQWPHALYPISCTDIVCQPESMCRHGGTCSTYNKPYLIFCLWCSAWGY